MRRRVRLASRSMIWRTALRPKATHSLPVLQAFTMGKPAMRTVSAWQGRVLEGVSFVAERTHPGPTGPSTMVRHIEKRGDAIRGREAGGGPWMLRLRQFRLHFG